jgi:hypothetical protein
LRRVILLGAVLVLAGALVAGVVSVFVYNSFGIKGEETLSTGSAAATYVRCPVIVGEITRTYEVDSAVVSGRPELYLKTIVVDKVTDWNFELLKDKGDAVMPGDTLYYYGWDAWESVYFSGFVADIRYEEVAYPPAEGEDEDEDSDIVYQRVSIDLLDYDSLYLVTQVDVTKFAQISYETPVKVIYDKQEYPAKVINIGYEAQGGEVSVHVSLPLKLLPGMEAKVSYELETVEQGMYLLEDVVFFLGDTSYVLLETGGEPQQTKVTLGQTFAGQGENDYNYVEVLSGLREGDTVLLEYMPGDNKGAAIAELYGSQ